MHPLLQQLGVQAKKISARSALNIVVYPALKMVAPPMIAMVIVEYA